MPAYKLPKLFGRQTFGDDPATTVGRAPGIRTGYTILFAHDAAWAAIRRLPEEEQPGQGIEGARRRIRGGGA